jgi:sugar/nucleoside kinase (ribokinase family)
LGPHEKPPIVIGLGALNIDHIATTTQLSKQMHEVVTESAARFEWNLEMRVEENVIVDAIDRLGAATLSSSLGGSAWVMMYSLAQIAIDIGMGFIGIVGRVESPGLSFLRQMDKLGIDRRWVGEDRTRISGMCLSYVEDADRVMLTHPGANEQIGHFLEQNMEDIARYIAGAAHLHVTSLIDDKTPGVLDRLLSRARELNPALVVSLDPGFVWANSTDPEVRGLLRHVDLLFVNYREFKAIGQRQAGESDHVTANRLLRACRNAATVFIIKRYDYVEAHTNLDGVIESNRFQTQRTVSESEIEDATGAGDIFSASVIAALLSRRFQVSLGAQLGLTLARDKLRSLSWQKGYRPFDLGAGYLQQPRAFRSETSSRRVLIVHDNHEQATVLRKFLEGHCKLATYAIDLDVTALTAGIDTIDPTVLHACSFAVCIVDHEGQSESHRSVAVRQELVLLLGMLQGRYGFNRVALFVGTGSELFSNIAGLLRMDFSSGRIDTAFLRLEDMLVREGLME